MVNTPTPAPAGGEAERELKGIGLGGLRAVLDALCNREMGTEPDCDCAHEHWHIGAAGACLDIHVEPEGWTHCILDLGDVGHEIELHGITTLDQARGIAFLWAATITGDLTALRTRPTDDLAVARVEELPMTAFADAVPVRDELGGEQTILIHNASATWDIAFFESLEPFPDRWFGEHWIDITGMWPGVTAQVTEWRRKQDDDIAVAVEALRHIKTLQRSIMIDVGSCHKSRGPAASSEMRSDDRDMRRDMEDAFAKIDAALSKLTGGEA